MDKKYGFAQRLQDAMIRAGHAPRPSVLEREFNTRYWGTSVTLQAVRRWLRGEAVPSQEKLQVLAQWLKVEPQLLRFGEVECGQAQETQAQWITKLDAQEREIFDVFLQLPAQQRKLVRDVILTFAKSYLEQADSAGDEPSRQSKLNGRDTSVQKESGKQ